MAATSTESFQFSNVGTGATSTFSALGGEYMLTSVGTGFGSQQLQTLGFDASTWLNVGAAVTGNGTTTMDLAPGQYRFNITTATANYLALTRVPK